VRPYFSKESTGQVKSRRIDGCETLPACSAGVHVCLLELVAWYRRSKMSWVSDAIEALRDGKQVVVRPRGGSMRGRIEDGQAVTLAPVEPSEVRVDDIALVRWKGNVLLHLVKEVDGDRVLIGNNVGKINGWAMRTDILGRVIDVHAQ
jgi:Peptidase S24-like